MTTKVVPGQLVATVTSESAANEAAARIGRILREKSRGHGRIAMALSGGNTPRPAFADLARAPGIDWARVDLFWVDERAVPPTDDQSNFKWANEILVVPAKIASVFRMPADAPNLDEAARDYEAIIKGRVVSGERGVPVFDIVLLGIGDDGHTASLFPGEPEVRETKRWIVPVAAKGSRVARLSMTAPLIENAAALFILATGAGKTAALERAWSTTGTADETPARIIRDARGAITWIIDRAAGGVTS